MYFWEAVDQAVNHGKKIRFKSWEGYVQWDKKERKWVDQEGDYYSLPTLIMDGWEIVKDDFSLVQALVLMNEGAKMYPVGTSADNGYVYFKEGDDYIKQCLHNTQVTGRAWLFLKDLDVRWEVAEE